jgi:hypothetical protein
MINWTLFLSLKNLYRSSEKQKQYWDVMFYVGYTGSKEHKEIKSVSNKMGVGMLLKAVAFNPDFVG